MCFIMFCMMGSMWELLPPTLPLFLFFILYSPFYSCYFFLLKSIKTIFKPKTSARSCSRWCRPGWCPVTLPHNFLASSCWYMHINIHVSITAWYTGLFWAPVSGWGLWYLPTYVLPTRYAIFIFYVLSPPHGKGAVLVVEGIHLSRHLPEVMPRGFGIQCKSSVLGILTPAELSLLVSCISLCGDRPDGRDAVYCHLEPGLRDWLWFVPCCCPLPHPQLSLCS